MDTNLYLLYKDLAIESISETEIYKKLKSSKKDILYILVPVSSENLIYLRVKPSRFIKPFKRITFEYSLALYVYGTDYCDRVDVQDNSIEFSTPIEFYTFLYSLDRIEAFTALYTSNDIEEYTAISLSNFIITFESEKGKTKILNSVSYSDFEDFDDMYSVNKIVNEFFSTEIIGKGSNVVSKPINEILYINSDGQWGYRGINRILISNAVENVMLKCDFKVHKAEKRNPMKCYNYLESVPGYNYFSVMFVRPEDMSLLCRIDQSEITILNIAYTSRPEDFPYDMKICTESVYNDTTTMEYFEILGADATFKFMDAFHAMENIMNARSILECASMMASISFGSLVNNTIVEFTLYPVGHHQTPFIYTLHKDNVNKIKDIYDDLFKKLRKYMLEIGGI